MRRHDFSTAIVFVLAALLPGQLFAQHAKKTPGSSTSPSTPGGDSSAPEGNNGQPKKHHHKDGPIVLNWPLKDKHLKGEKGDANVTINEDGTWSYSGTFPTLKDHDLDIVMSITSSEGSVYLFRFAGPLTHGAQWQKQGQSQTLADNFRAFEHYTAYFEYKTYLSKAGVAKKYEAKERKKKHLKKEELEKEQAKEAKEVELAAKEHPGQKHSGKGGHSAPPAQGSPPSHSNGGGGGGSSILLTVDSVVSTIGSVGSAIASIF